MNKRTRIAGLVGASTLLMGMMLAGTGVALAADNTQFWAGNGSNPFTSDCATDSSAHQLWIWTGTGSNVTISVDGEVVVGVQQGNGAYQFATGWHDLSTLTTGPTGNVWVTYDGAADTNAVLTLSHGCAGTEQSAPPTEVPPTEAPSFEQSQADTTDAPSTAPSFEQSQADITQCPCDTTPGLANTSHPADGAWLLVVALGVLLASVVVLTPARVKNRR
jgi:hypothetical protein